MSCVIKRFTFKGLLQSIHAKCPDYSENDVGDIIVKARNLIRERGKEMSLLEVANGIDQSISQEVQGKIDLVEVSSAFVIIVCGE